MKRNWLRHLVPNLGTVLTVAFLLFVYRAWAAPALPAPAAPGVAAPATLTATTVQPEGATVNAVTPGVISYQGTLTDASGKPLNGTSNMTFRLYTAPTGGTAVWTEAHTGANAVPVSNGLFNVLLGSLTPIPSEVWSNVTLYLGVQVGSDAEMAPREIVGGAPALNPVQIQSGYIEAGYATFPDWNLISGNGYRTYTIHVTFAKSFATIPTVRTALMLLDLSKDTIQRLRVYPTNITPDGFDLNIHTWADSIVYQAGVTWIAHAP